MDILKDYIDANPDKFYKLDDKGLKRFHEILLAMVDDLLQFCTTKNLTLYATGGTALGVVRHKGFIPWDEDVDFSMPRKDCNVLLKEFTSFFNGKYFIEAPNSNFVGNHVFIKIKKKNTVMTDLLTKEGCTGFCIDIFPIDYASPNKIIRTLQGFRFMTIRNLLYVISFSRQYYLLMREGFKNCGLKTRLIAYCGVGIGKFFGLIPLEKWINHYDRIVQRKKYSDYWVTASGIHSYTFETFHSSIYTPLRYGVFDGRKICIPNRVEALLEKLYGDYMTLPPENKRAKHFFLEISFDETEGSPKHNLDADANQISG